MYRWYSVGEIVLCWARGEGRGEENVSWARWSIRPGRRRKGRRKRHPTSDLHKFRELESMPRNDSVSGVFSFKSFFEWVPQKL